MASVTVFQRVENALNSYFITLTGKSFGDLRNQNLFTDPYKISMFVSMLVFFVTLMTLCCIGTTFSCCCEKEKKKSRGSATVQVDAGKDKATTDDKATTSM